MSGHSGEEQISYAIQLAWLDSSGLVRVLVFWSVVGCAIVTLFQEYKNLPEDEKNVDSMPVFLATVHSVQHEQGLI